MMTSILTSLKELRQKPLFHYGEIVAVCCLYMLVGPSLILLNKHILKDLGFNYPMFLSSLGLVFASAFSIATIHCTNFVQLEHSARVTWAFWFKRIVPVGACTAATLTFGNAVYLHLSVAFIQMLKAFTPVIVLVVVVAARLEKPTTKVVLSVVVICVGTAIAGIGEVNVTAIGLIFMFLAEFMEAIRLVMTQYLLQNLKFGIVEGQYYLAPAGAICLLSVAMLMEVPKMVSTKKYMLMWEHPFLFLGAASLGLCVQFVTFLVIQLTSSVTLKVLGTARNAGLVVFSFLFLGEIVTWLQGVGYMLSLIAFGFYNYFKMQKPAVPIIPNSTPNEPEKIRMMSAEDIDEEESLWDLNDEGRRGSEK